MSGQEALLHSRHFFTQGIHDYRGGLWKSACMNAEDPRVPISDASSIAQHLLMVGAYDQSAKDKLSNVHGLRNEDISPEITAFLVDVGRYHRSIDASLATKLESYKYLLGAIKETAAALAHPADATSLADYRKIYSDDAMNRMVISGPEGIARAFSEDAQRFAAHYEDPMSILHVLLFEYTRLRKSGEAHSSIFAEKGEREFDMGGHLAVLIYSFLTGTTAYTEDNLQLFAGSPETLTSSLTKFYAGLSPDAAGSKIHTILHALIQMLVPFFQKSFSDFYTHSTASAADTLVYLDPTKQNHDNAKLMMVTIGGYIGSLGSAIEKAISDAVRVVVPEIVNKKTTLEESEAARALYKRIYKTSTTPGARTESFNFMNIFLRLARYDTVKGVWMQPHEEQLKLDTHIPESEFRNYRLNLNSCGINPLFYNTFFKLMNPICGIVYLDGMDKRYKREDLNVADERSQYILREIYLSAYRADPAASSIAVELGRKTINIAVTPVAQQPKYFNVHVESLISRVWERKLQAEQKAVQAIQDADPDAPTSEAPELLTKGSVYRDEEGQWWLIDMNGVSVPYGMSSERVREDIKKGPCSVAGFNSRDASACLKFLASVLPSGTKVEVLQAISALTAADSSMSEVKKMHPEVAVTILEKLGFLKVTDGSDNGRPVTRFGTVDDWNSIQRDHDTDLHRVMDGPNHGTIIKYLQAIWTRTRSIQSTLNWGLDNPAPIGSAILTPLSNRLGLQVSGPNVYRIRANAHYNLANDIAPRVAVIPSGTNGVMMVPRPTSARMSYGHMGGMIGGGKRRVVQSGGRVELEFNRANWEAAKAAAPAGKRLSSAIMKKVDDELKEIEEIQAKRRQTMSHLLFGKQMALTLGDHSPQVYQILDLQAKEAEYRRLEKEMKTRTYNFNRDLAGIFQSLPHGQNGQPAPTNEREMFEQVARKISQRPTGNIFQYPQ